MAVVKHTRPQVDAGLLFYANSISYDLNFVMFIVVNRELIGLLVMGLM